MTGQKILRIALILAIGAALLWLSIAFFLPVLLPFGIGLLVAKLAQPIAQRLHSVLRFPQWAATFLCVSAVFAALAFGVWLLLRTLFSQLGTLAAELPALTNSLSGPLDSLRGQLLRLCARAPASLAPTLTGWTQSLFQSGSMLGERLSERAFSIMGGMVTSLPDVLLFTVTAILSSFMLCSRLPELKKWLKNRLPLRWQTQLSQFRQQLRGVLSGWCKAQLKLTLLTFAIVTAGLFFLKLPYALILGTVIALVDALPILGAGTVLLPWGAVALLQGNTQQGLGLVLLYGITALTRTTLEPRLIGRQLGLNPLLTLLALYAGFRLCGITGMLLFPIGATLLRQIYELMETALQRGRPGSSL